MTGARFSRFVPFALFWLAPGLPAATQAAGVDPPPGVVSYCLRYGCDAPAVASTAAPDRIWSMMTEVNLSVNRYVHPARDENHFGRGVRIARAEDGFGDCNTYAAVKQAMLKAVGIEGSLAEVRIWDGELHMVLVVRLSGTDFVLDNLTDDIRPLSETGYALIEREDPSDHQKWEAAAQ